MKVRISVTHCVFQDVAKNGVVKLAVSAVKARPCLTLPYVHARRRARVRREVFRGTEVAGAHRSGSEGAVAAVLGFAAAAYAAYFCAPGFASGALLGARARAAGPTAHP